MPTALLLVIEGHTTGIVAAMADSGRQTSNAVIPIAALSCIPARVEIGVLPFG
jgi:hypothetical protein